MSGFELTGTGFNSGDSIRFEWDSPVTTLATVTVRADGTIGPVQASVPAGSSTGLHAISAFLGSTLEDTVSFAVDPPPASNLNVTPTHGLAGGGVTFDGADYPAGAVSIEFDVPATVLATTAGPSFSGVTGTIPATAGAGTHTISAKQSGNVVATTPYTVDPSAAAVLNVAPSHGLSGSGVVFSGANWPPNAAVSVVFDTPNTVLASPVTDANGSFSNAAGTIPPTATAGSHTITGTSGAVSDGVAYTVDPATPSPTLSSNPASGASHRNVTITGQSWTPNTAVTLTWVDDSSVLASPVADSGGNISATVAIPNTAAVGAHTIHGAQGTNAADVTYTVVAATLLINPDTGPTGTSVAFSGANWRPGTTVIVTNSTNATAIGTATAAADGTMSGSGAITSVAGANTVHATDGDGNATRQIDVTYTGTGTVPTLVISPNRGPCFSLMNITGDHWAPGSSVTLSNVALGTDSGTATANASGHVDFGSNIHSSSNQCAVGAYTYRLTQGVNTADADFHVVVPTCVINPTSGPVNTQVAVSGADWRPSRQISFLDPGFPSGQQVESTSPSTITADANGSIPANSKVVIKASTPNGARTIRAQQSETGGPLVAVDNTFTVGTQPTTTLSVVPTSGPGPSTVMAFNGDHYTPNSTVTIRSNLSSGFVVTQAADANGHFTINVNAPTEPGLHTMTGTDNASTPKSASCTFNVTTAAVVLSVNPVSSPGGSVSCTFTGSGYSPNSTVTIRSDVESGYVKTVVADSSGAISLATASPAASGHHTLTGTDNGNTPRSAYCTFDVAQTTTLVVSPTSGPAGTSLSFTGNGYNAGAMVTIRSNLNSGYVVEFTADGSGHFGPNVTPGPASPAGTHTLTGTDNGGIPRSASCTFNLTAPPVAFSCTPTSGPPSGVSTSFHGTGFTPGASVQIRSNIEPAYLVGATVDASGTFTQSAFSPDMVGHHTLTATDNSSPAKSASCAFDVVQATRLSVSPTSGSQGIQLDFAGSGYTPNSTVRIIDNQDSTFLLSGSVDSGGSFSHAHNSPAGPPGTHTFTGTDNGSPARSASCTFQKTSTSNATIVSDKSSTDWGRRLLVTGVNWGPNEGVTVRLSPGDQLIASLSADNSGSVNGLGFLMPGCPIPAAGSYTLQAIGQTSGKTATTPFTINPPRPNPLSGHSVFPPNVPVGQQWGWFRDPSCTQLSDADCQSLTHDVMVWINNVVCGFWNIGAQSGTFYSSQDAIPSNFWRVGFFGDNTGCKETCGGDHYTVGPPLYETPFARIFTSYRGGSFGLSQIERIASHEAAEMIVDPSWTAGIYEASDSGGTCYICEVGDPVEYDTYTFSTGTYQSRTFTDFVLPNYFTSGSSGPWDYLNLLSGPFTYRSRSVTAGSCGGTVLC